MFWTSLPLAAVLCMSGWWYAPALAVEKSGDNSVISMARYTPLWMGVSTYEYFDKLGVFCYAWSNKEPLFSFQLNGDMEWTI